MSDRIDVLGKVKELFLIPKLNIMTIRQVADYYEVDVDTIKKVYNRNKNEICNDGVIKETPRTFKEKKEMISGLLEREGQLVPFVKTKSGIDIQLTENIRIAIPNCGVTCFSQRAVLRIGMLLRDSKVAKEVRTQLLNTFDNATSKQRTEALGEEKDLCYNFAKSITDGDIDTAAVLINQIMQFSNRHNEELKKQIANLEQENKRLSETNLALKYETIDCDTRRNLYDAVRKLAWAADEPTAYVFNNLYDLLAERYNIGLRLRGEKTIHSKYSQD